MTRSLLKEVLGVVQDYAKKKKYTVVMEKNRVVYSEGGVDITDAIIKAYDKKKAK